MEFPAVTRGWPIAQCSNERRAVCVSMYMYVHT